MIVVSNTSPLTNLAAIGQFDLLHSLYARLNIPDGVEEELSAGGRHWPGHEPVTQADWIQRHTVQNRTLVTALRRDLGLGESESIALALELGADLILLDEKEGRHTAQRLGLRVIGVIGILLEAKTQGAIDKVGPSLDALRQTAGFYLSEQLYQSILLLTGESKTSF
jgi:predicted nucleic acid-binding protein